MKVKKVKYKTKLWLAQLSVILTFQMLDKLDKRIKINNDRISFRNFGWPQKAFPLYRREVI